jgi:uncharacterized repeat protein (TIGR02543 family)
LVQGLKSPGEEDPVGKIGRCILALVLLSVPALATESVVAIHVSEVTQALESTPAVAPTPTGAGTTGKQWWIPWWHYFVMPESVKEALRSDGTPFVVVTDADITAGVLLTADGKPRYPIVISLAAEAIRDDEVSPLRSYVSAGGFLFVGSSSFTRRPNGTTRGDFALASEMGVHTASGDLEDWVSENDMAKNMEHRLVSQIPVDYMTWEMPLTSEDISWGVSPEHLHQAYHYLWQVTVGDATEITSTSHSPYLLTKAYGQGRFIYDAGLQPLVGHGGHAPGMYAYSIFRNAIAWAFEVASLPLMRVSPWPYAYNAAYMVRHDLENSQWAITNIEESAQAEHSVGAKGDYYFCTGTLRDELGNDPEVVASIREAISLYGATIGSHNGGLKNPNNPDLSMEDFDYWHWGLDEALDKTPPGYANGRAYAYASLVSSFADIDGWLAGLTTNKRTWVSPYFSSTREASYEILEQAGVTAAGEQKLTPFPHWTLSTQTLGKHFSFVSLPASDWVVGERVRHGLDDGHDESTIQALVDSYYDQGALVNLYSHNLSTDQLPNVYLLACAAKPAIWATNATDVTAWWIKRSPVQITTSSAIVGNRLVATIGVSGATDTATAIELSIPNWALASTGLQVKLNGATADPSSYRIYHEGIKVKVGTTVSTVEVSYPNAETGVPPVVTEGATTSVTMDEDNSPTPFALTLHATDTDGDTLTWSIQAQASHGTATASGTGTSKVIGYTPTANYNGSDSFVVQVADGHGGTASITVNVTLSARNDAPVNTVPGGQTVSEDTNLVFSSANGNPISAADVDVDETTAPNNTLRATLSVGRGQLTLSRTTGLTFNSGSNGSASMAFTGSSANINAALNGMTYRGDADYSGGDALTVLTSDLAHTGAGGTQIDTDGVAITVNATNDPPVLAGAGNTLAYAENQAATPICTTITLTDPDDVTLEAAVVSISSNYVNGQDVLGFVNTAKITGSWVSSTGTLTLTRVGGQTPALSEWRDALRSITYVNTSENPSSSNRTVSFIANDGDANSNIVTSTITVTPENDTPVITEGVATSVTSDEDNSPTAFAKTLNATDPDAADTLTWSIQTQASHGTATAPGTGTSKAIGYTPAANWNGSDSFVVQVSDGHGGTDTITVNVTVSPRNDPPNNTAPPTVTGAFHIGNTLTANNGTWADSTDVNPGVLAYTYQWQRADDGGGTGAADIGGATGFTHVVDAADNAKYLSVRVTATDNGEGLPASASTAVNTPWTLVANSAPLVTEGASAPVTSDEDNSPTPFALTLHATDTDGDTLTWSIQTAASHGAAAASGTGASKVISYAPTSNYNGSDSFVVQVSDGNGGTDPITVNVTVNRVNDAPVNAVPVGQTVNEDTNLVFGSANGNPISIGDIDVDETAPPNNTLQVTLTAGHGQLTLSRTTGLTLIVGDGTLDPTMTFRGTASNINAAMNGMVYRGETDYSGSDNLSITTSDLGNTGSGGALVDADSVTITVNNTNDPPVLAGAGNTLAYAENQAATPICTTITLTDPDDVTVEAAVVSISSNYVNGQDILAFINTAKITGIWAPSTGTLTLTRVGGQTPALDQWRDALRSVTYVNSSENPSSSNRTVSFIANDGDANSNVVISTIAVTPVNDAPTVSAVTAASVGDANAGGTAYDFTVTFADDSAVNISTLDNNDVYVTTPTAGTISATYVSVDTPGNGSPRTATYRIVPPGGSWDVADNGTYAIGITGSQVGDANGAFVAASANIGTFAVALETVAPTVTNVTSSTPDGAYKAGQAITVQIAFSETVNVSGLPRLTLETGTTDAVAGYAGGSGSTTLAFLYTVTAGQETPDLDYISAGALALNGGTIKDAAGNGATLTLPLPGSPGSLGANKAIVIDTTAPAAPSAPDLEAASDTGSSSTDNITDDTTPTFDITGLESGATVTLSSSVGGILGTVVVGIGHNSCTITALTALAQGAHVITATQTDTAGNISAASPAMAPNLYIAVSPAVTTQAVTDVTSVGATGHGAIVALGVPNPTAHGVVWNTTGAPTLSDSSTNEGSASAAGDFTSSMTSLNPNATYYVRAYATNNLLTAYGNEVSFSTLLTYTLTIAAANGSVTKLPDQTTYEHGATVQLTASPSTGYHFVNWTGDASGSTNPLTVNMDANKTITANFAISNFTVSGTVKIDETGLPGVTMAGLPGAPVTGLDGTYAATVNYGWSGTVTPTLAGYTFVPVSRTYTTVTADQAGQNYTATGSAQTITVTSPNGGESWAAGSTHNITWTQTGLTGTVTVDLYKGGVWQKILGTPAATAGTFSWVIATNETAATDYRIRIWQTGASDDSNANFALVRTARVDFNGDGQEDLLWRYYGTGGYNRVWFLGSSGETLPLSLAASPSAGSGLMGQRTTRTFLSDPRDLGVIPDRKGTLQTKNAQEAMNTRNIRASGVATVDDPRMAGLLSSGSETPGPAMSIADPRQVLNAGSSSDVRASIASRTLLGGADVLPVGDMNWQVKGTGDFNGDGNVDILWRYNGAGGSNVVWLMDGANWMGSSVLLSVSDLNWQIVGTGDFNRDGNIDILWRYNGPGGYIVVWFMDGVSWIGSAQLLSVDDLNWQIMGTGDFNRDGNIDILWRYNGNPGYVYLWYMNGTNWIGGGNIISVGDLSWQIMGTGDYNNDGNIDILWRYNGVGGAVYIWYLNGATWIGGEALLPVADLTWKIVNR